MSEKEVVVSVDDRARVVMAALAASDWPAWEQAQQPHAVHQHSKQTRHFVAGHDRHEAIITLNQALDTGIPLEDLFAASLRSSWPDFKAKEPLPVSIKDGKWCTSLAQFSWDSGIEAFWIEHKTPWDIALGELTAVFHGRRIIQFLSQFQVSPTSLSVRVIPCIVYPMLTPVLAETAADLFLILPPAKAWGESPPWPFGEDPGWVVAQTCWYLTAYFMSTQLSQVDATYQVMLRHAAVTLCLEQEFDEAEAMAYLVRNKKEQSLPQLPLVVDHMREVLAGLGIESLLDFA